MSDSCLRDDTGRSFRAVGFGMADSLPPTRAVDAVVSLKTDYYRGNRRRELRLHDILRRVSERRGYLSIIC